LFEYIFYSDETVSTLKFGQLCKTIKNNVKNNEVVDDRALLKMYKNMVADLRQQLQMSRPRLESSYGLGLDEMDGGMEGNHENFMKMRSELSKLRKENADLRASVSSLQGAVKESSELEALKNSLDEYQRESQVAVDEERSKLEQEKEYLLVERTKILTEKTHLDEKVGDSC
jgi:small-conductance mechanosensitive channel